MLKRYKMPGHTISSWFWTRSLIRSIGAALVLATAYNNASKELQEGVDASIFTAETPPMRKSAAKTKAVQCCSTIKTAHTYL